MDEHVIRPATEADLERLVEIEVEAGRLFHAVGMAEVARHVPEVAPLNEAMRSSRVWVAEADGALAAYVVAELLDGNAHVAQVSVSPEYAGRRIGKSLIEHVESWGRAKGCPATTLTTFRDVPWNGPYYLRLGYRVLPDEHAGPELARTMAREASMPGIDASLRCAMVKPG